MTNKLNFELCLELPHLTAGTVYPLNKVRFSCCLCTFVIGVLVTIKSVATTYCIISMKPMYEIPWYFVICLFQGQSMNTMKKACLLHNVLTICKFKLHVINFLLHFIKIFDMHSVKLIV